MDYRSERVQADLTNRYLEATAVLDYHPNNNSCRAGVRLSADGEALIKSKFLDIE